MPTVLAHSPLMAGLAWRVVHTAASSTRTTRGCVPAAVIPQAANTGCVTANACSLFRMGRGRLCVVWWRLYVHDMVDRGVKGARGLTYIYVLLGLVCKQNLVPPMVPPCHARTWRGWCVGTEVESTEVWRRHCGAAPTRCCMLLLLLAVLHADGGWQPIESVLARHRG